MKLRLLIILFFCVFSLHSSGQYYYDFNKNCITAYKSILALKFKEGKKYIAAEKSKHPNNNIPYVLENYIHFLTLFIGEEENTYKKLKNNKDNITERLENGDENSPYHLYSQALVNLQWAFVRTKFREYMPAIIEINRAYRMLEDNKDKFPGFIPNNMYLGVMHSLIGTIPDKYSWVKGLVSVEGTIPQGMKELKVVIDKADINKEYEHLKVEALFYLTFIHLNLMSDKSEAIKYVDYFDSGDPEFHTNPLVIYAKARIFMNLGKNDQAIETLLARPKGSDRYPFWYLDYLAGVAKLNRLDPDAYEYLFNFVLHFRGVNYIKSAYQKLAWFYLINNNMAKYKEYIAKTKRYGYDLVDSDQQAEEEAAYPLPPNVALLKARLLCDGGYFQKAIDELLAPKKNLKLKTEKDSLEFNYRLARIYHEWGKPEKSILYYEKTIKLGGKSQYYYAANSALKLGNIYENSKNFKKAKYYYELVATMKNKEYKNSIASKAKAGLNRIGSK